MIGSSSSSSSGALLYVTSGLLVGGALSWLLFGRRKKEQTHPFFARRDRTASNHQQHHVDFLTGIVAQLWLHMRPAGSDMIKLTLEPMLKEYNMTLLKADLGDVPLLLDRIVVHPHQKENDDEENSSSSLQFDMDVIWDGHCEVKIKANAAGGATFGIKTIRMAGRLTFLLKPLSDTLPCIDCIQYSFVNQPQLELGFSGLAKFANLAFVEGTVKDTIRDALASLVVLPNRMYYKMNPTCDLFTLYQPPLGVLRIQIQSGRGFQIEKRAIQKDDIPDVYCLVNLGNSTIKKTPVIKDSLEPVWKDKSGMMDFVLYDYDQSLTINTWDEDTGALDADDFLGNASITVRELLLSKGRTMELELNDEDDKCNGAFITVSCNLLPFSTDSSIPAVTSPLTNKVPGILTVLVKQLHDLPMAKKDAATFVKVSSSASPKDTAPFVTSQIKDIEGVDALNPVYDGVFYFEVPPKEDDGGTGGITLSVMNNIDDKLSTIQIPYKSLMTTTTGETIVQEKKMILDGKIKGASLEYAVHLYRPIEQGGKPTAVPLPPPLPPAEELSKTKIEATSIKELSMSGLDNVIAGGSVAADDDEVNASALGTVRITLVKGRGFQVRKKRRVFQKDDIPDVYCKIQYGAASTKMKKKNKAWYSNVVKDSVTPQWNESKTFTCYSYGDTITVDAYDSNKGKIDTKKGKDHCYGTGTIRVGKLLLGGGGVTETELMDTSKKGGKATGLFIAIKAELVE